MAWAELYERGRRRGGVVVRQDATECGVDIDEYDFVVSRDRWRRPYVGARLLPGTPHTPLVDLRAAVLSVKGEVAADRWSAAWLLGGRRRPPRPHLVVVPRNRRPRRDDDLEIRRTGWWRPDHVTEVNGVRTLIAPRLLVDLGDLGVGERPLGDLCLALRRTTGMTGDSIRVLLDERSRVGNRSVIERLADLLDQVGSESGLEQLARELLIAEGFHPDAFQLTVDTVNGRRRLDIVFSEAKVGIEVQSKEYHGDVDAMTRDARKMNAFADGQDWLVLLLTPQMMSGAAWAEFVGVLGRALERRGG